MGDNMFTLAGIIVGAIFASTGFWQFIIAVWQTKSGKQNMLEKAVLAMLHDKIFEKAERYIKRGAITVRELDNLRHLFTPYKGLGGNGTGEQLFNTCLKLPIVSEEEADEMDKK